MTRGEIVSVLSDLTASAERKQAAYSHLRNFPEHEQRTIMREASQKTFADMMAVANPEFAASLPVPPSVPAADSAPSIAASLAAPAPIQPELLPATIDVCDTSGWSDTEEFDLWELWAYYKEDSTGDAKLYNRLNRNRIVFVKHWNRFLVWKGHFWAEDDHNAAYQRVEAIVRQYQRLAEEQEGIMDDPGASKDEKAKALNSFQDIRRRIKTLRSKNGQDNVMAQVTRVPNPLQIMPEHIDKQPYTFPCVNGCVDLKTGELHPGKPTDYLYSSCPTEFDPELFASENPCPVAEAFLLSCMNGKQELVDYIWRMLGYSMIGEKTAVHAFIIMWGPHGRNGKDTLCKMVSHVLGDELSGDVPVELILQTGMPRNSGAPSPDVMALNGMRVAWINEAEDGQRFAMAKVKKYTGGARITGRGLQDRKMTTFYQSFLPIMLTNELPRAKGEDRAFWTRASIIKWELSFVEDPQEEFERPVDKHLDEKLRAEAKGILARMVQGALEFQRLGSLAPPEAVKAWTSEEQSSMDDIQAFLEECCVLEYPRQSDPNAYEKETRAKDLLDAWVIWYGDNRDKKHIPSGRTLGILLDKKGIPKRLSNGTLRRGIELNALWAAIVSEEQDRQEAERKGGKRAHLRDDTSRNGGYLRDAY